MAPQQVGPLVGERNPSCWRESALSSATWSSATAFATRSPVLRSGHQLPSISLYISSPKVMTKSVSSSSYLSCASLYTQICRRTVLLCVILSSITTPSIIIIFSF